MNFAIVSSISDTCTLNSNIHAIHCLHGLILVDILQDIFEFCMHICLISTLYRKITMKHCLREFDIWWIRIALMIHMSKQICYFRLKLLLTSILAFFFFFCPSLSFYLSIELSLSLIVLSTYHTYFLGDRHIFLS